MNYIKITWRDHDRKYNGYVRLKYKCNFCEKNVYLKKGAWYKIDEISYHNHIVFCDETCFNCHVLKWSFTNET